MSESIIVALIAGAASIGGAGIGAYFSNRKSSALITYRLEQLEKKVDKHNSVVERTYALEQQQAVQEERLDVANHRIADLEAITGHMATDK
nr:hypothetical protein [uncultured Dysosmobacter sp.]